MGNAECANCGTDLDGGEIPRDIVHHYVPWEVQKEGNATVTGWLDNNPWPHFYLNIGHEISGVYDGVLFWSCPKCGFCWHRWEDQGMRNKAQPFIDQWNEEVNAYSH